jgi:cell division protease FtsH
MAKTLLEWETIDAEQILDIMEGRPPRPPKSTTATASSTGGSSSSPGGGIQEATQPA